MRTRQWRRLDRRLVLGPLAPAGVALLVRARRDGRILRLSAVGRYGPYWWLRLSTAAQPITVLSRTLRLSSNGGGAPVAPVPVSHSNGAGTLR
jgi:hypothetical protein